MTLQTTRLCATLGLALAAWGAQAADTTRVIVSFDSAQSLARADMRQAVARLGGSVKVDLAHVQAVAVEVPTSALAKLRSMAGVKAVEIDQKRYLPEAMPAAERSAAMAEQMMGAESLANPTRQRMPYGIGLVQAKRTIPLDTAPLKVCIIDSGLDSTHPDLQGVEMAGDDDPGGTGGWNEPPLNAHGTHVAGTIAAVNNSIGVVGVASKGEVSLHIERVFGSDGAWAYSSTLAAASQKCKAAGAKVISMSLGGYFPNSAERDNFAQLERDGIINVAAAGNDGARIKSYPASYPAVISVAAVDHNADWATFSTFNSEVEVSAPGVSVWSTVPVGAGSGSTLRQAGSRYSSLPLEGSPATGTTPVMAATYDFGLGDAVDGGAAGKTCLIQRGTISFADKVLNCQNSGGISAVIYNNVAGNFNGTLGGTATTIPSVSVSDTDGAAMKAAIPADTRMRVVYIDYGVLSGTSMATPHVAGVAAKLWRAHPECTNTEIRATLGTSARDLLTAGRDEKTGYGLVQLADAHQRIMTMGCGN